MVRILGVDPGSRITGYGIVDAEGARLQLVEAGCVATASRHFPARLKAIYDGILAVVETWRPEVLAVEQVFMHKNADSALKLGQARGAAICAGLARDLPVHEYATRQVKQAVVGRGGADKQQVQYMVKLLLNFRGELALDASDALAVALCHAHYQQTRQRLAVSAR
ncbi:crossover junction endodeoxyribonuclease RuvC [Methylomarinovum caldicuralii]|uniref:Crossover junction endodeoxyribonuclease RuvC n=1 Tax=Methylomarinovum caldicuralii TaxID=438856 RepID=A0AAU9C5R7_9GAMM|nr:crossover junction endodeoxyribonuclease RuvC [Methylomarinovum caldicuralii]BCX81254.1 crossover junction endodeoxyribonuclease RuvC [Methylomarinovum caldicuralii]